jgi:hypothetical protein
VTAEHMSQETFDANQPVIRAGVEAIMRNPQRRKTSRIFALYDSGDNTLLAEVFRTPFGPVIAHRSWGSVDRLTTVVVGAPQGRGKAELVVAPLTDDPDQRFPIMARAFRYRLPVRNLREWIAQGKPRHAISYRVV